MINDTIAGVSTAVGNSGISVIRMSGSDSEALLIKYLKGRKKVKEQSHTIQYGKLFLETNEVIDEVLLTKMVAPEHIQGKM